MISPCNLENGSLYIHATWETNTFHLFVNIFNFWWRCYDIDVIYMYIDVTIFKTKGNIFETMSSQNMTLVASHVIPNIFFGKESIHKRKGSSPKDSRVFSLSNVKYFKFS